jgi:hypothetical protein
MAQTTPPHLTGALRKDEPQAIYADDPRDSWNRIFHCLFTRTLKIRLSLISRKAHRSLSNTRLFPTGRDSASSCSKRIESGDRAVEPLFPQEHFRDDVSTVQLLTEPRFTAFKNAVAEALAETRVRPALERALMQSDLWAAYDFLSRDVSAWILKDAPVSPLSRAAGAIAKARRTAHPEAGTDFRRD